MTSPLSGSILYRDLQKTLDLLEAEAKEWAEKAQRGQHNEETAAALAQVTLISLRSPDLIRALWEWGKAEELAGRLRDPQTGGELLRKELESWVQLLTALHEAARGSEAAGYPVSGADELEGAAEGLRATLREVNEAWPPKERGETPPLTYEELRSLAKRFPPPAQWYEEEDDLF
jgi:hypothetical protein